MKTPQLRDTNRTGWNDTLRRQVGTRGLGGPRSAFGHRSGINAALLGAGAVLLLLSSSAGAQSNYVICPPGWAVVKTPKQGPLRTNGTFELELAAVRAPTNIAQAVLGATNEIQFGDFFVQTLSDGTYDGTSSGPLLPVPAAWERVVLPDLTVVTQMVLNPSYHPAIADPVNLAAISPPDPPAGTNANSRQRAVAAVMQATCACLAKATNFTSPAFLDALGVSDQVKQWYAQGYRSDRVGLTRFNRPLVQFAETGTPSFMAVLAQDNTLLTTFMTGADYLDLASRIPMSMNYDCGVLLGDYAGLIADWLIADTNASTGIPITGWQQNNMLGLNNGLSAWVAYLHDGDTETYKYAWYVVRKAGNRPCGTTNNYGWAGTYWATNAGGFPDCFKGHNIRNVMMHSETNTTRNGVYPPLTPLTSYDGETSWDFAGVYFAAVFYDFSTEAGLGDSKVNLLYWKTFSVITNSVTFTMRDFGRYVLQAAAALWPDPAHPGLSYYDAVLKDVLRSRGIPVNGEPDFRSNLPLALQPVRVTSVNGFGSSQPDSQPTAGSYGSSFYSENSYTHTNAATNDYMVYQFYKHSKYGPCDLLKLTDGTFTTSQYNGDGSYYLELKDREPGNLLLLVPGRTIDWVRWRMRCSTEHEGHYIEDLQPFGFRVIQAIKNGFVWKTTQLSASGGTITYRFEIVDPSQATLGAAAYEWTFTDYTGATSGAVGTNVVYAALAEQPLGIRVSRVRDGVTNTIAMSEPGSLLDRTDRPHWLVGLRVPESSVSAADRGHYFNLEASPRFTGWQMLGDGSFDLVISGASNTVYRVEASATLAGWTDLGAATQTVAGVYHFVDGGAGTNEGRYYRVRRD